MCKILAMVGIKPENEKLAIKFAVEASDHMTGRPEMDGIGYAALTNDGNMYGERWLDPRDAFRNRFKLEGEEAQVIEAFQGALGKDVAYNTFGAEHFNKPITAWLQHSRQATTPKSLRNVHPFVLKDTALIHNGVIGNHQDFVKELSTCDSEAILQSYLGEEVATTPGNIEYTAMSLTGSYACAVLGKDAVGDYVDLFKNSHTSMVAAKITELGGLVYCTNLDILERTCKALNMTIEFSFEVNAGYLIRLDAATGEVRSVTKFSAQFDHSYRELRKAREKGVSVIPISSGSETNKTGAASEAEVKALEERWSRNYPY